MIRIIGFDADDTLWRNEDISERAHARYRALLAQYHPAGEVDRVLFATELRNLRAELALSLLRDPQYDALSTSQIASHAGFTNAAAMRRALHAIGAPTPQAARAR